jgi:hypothetical protein
MNACAGHAVITNCKEIPSKVLECPQNIMKIGQLAQKVDWRGNTKWHVLVRVLLPHRQERG